MTPAVSPAKLTASPAVLPLKKRVAEEAGYRVQFFSAVLQNRPGQSKISRAENSNRREKSPILRVPKPMP